jgi:S-formylglutathione hydrolase FrmB
MKYFFRTVKCIASICLILFSSGYIYAQQQLTINSSLIPGPDTVWVFTPSNYLATAQSYPVVYMLHGWSGNYKQWNSISTPQKFADEYGFVIVCPDGFFDSWYINSPVEKDHQYTSFFFQKLMPEIAHCYRIDSDRAFITGLSMGGYGALHLFLTHPDKFISAGSTSGVVDLLGAGAQFGLPKLLGKLEDHRSRWKHYSIPYQIRKLASTHKKIIFDCGWNGPFYKMNEALKDECDSLNIDATFVTRPGAHNHEYWRRSIPMHFFFFKNILNNLNKKQ